MPAVQYYRFFFLANATRTERLALKARGEPRNGQYGPSPLQRSALWSILIANGGMA